MTYVDQPTPGVDQPLPAVTTVDGPPTWKDVVSGDDAVPVALVVDRTAAFEEFYADQLRPVVALVLSLTGSRAVAEDVAQDAFAAAYRTWSTVGT